MADETPSAAKHHSSRSSFSIGGDTAFDSNSSTTKNTLLSGVAPLSSAGGGAGLDHGFHPYLSGAIMAARGERGSRHSCKSDNSLSTTGSRRSARLRIAPAFSVDAAPHSAEEAIDDDGLSSLLCTCLTANYISVGYLLVPWGKCATKATI